MNQAERAANPCDADDHMQPPDNNAQRLGNDGVHSLQSRLPDDATMAEGAGAVQACAGSMPTGERAE
jgi:hypothetical protein